MYLGLAAVGAGGFYLYRAGGDPKVAKDEMKCTPSLRLPSSSFFLMIDGGNHAMLIE